MIDRIYKFSASWCHPCKVLSDRLKEFDKVPIVEIDCDDSFNADIVKRYNIRNLPALIFADKEDRPSARLSGIVTLDSINEILEEYGYENK